MARTDEMNRKRRGRAALGLALGALLALTACSSSGSDSPSGGGGGGGGGGDGSGSGTYHVLALLALSGPASSNGKDIQRGIKLAVNDVNGSGGIDGHQVSITYKDDGGEGAQAVSLVQSALASGTKPDMVIAALSEDQVPIAPILTKQNILLLGAGRPAQLTDTTKFPLVFDTATDPVDIATAELKYASEHGWTTIGMLASNNAFGESQSTAFKSAAKSSDIKVTYGTYDATAVDATATLEKLKAAGPQAVFYSALGPIAGTILKNRATLGWTVPFIGDAGVAVNNVGAMVPASNLQGVVIQEQRAAVAGASGKSPAFEKFYAALKAQGAVNDPISGYGYGYDMLRIVQAGAKAAKSTDSTKIAKALETLPDSTPVTWVSKNGPLGFTAESHGIRYLPSDFIFAQAAALQDGLVPAG